MKSSRQETSIVDIRVSGSSSIYVLTKFALYKIKKGTTYYISQFMVIEQQNQDSEILDCTKVYIYDTKNLVWLLCSKAKIPYLVLSNWNSLTPTITFTQ